MGFDVLWEKKGTFDALSVSPIESICIVMLLQSSEHLILSEVIQNYTILVHVSDYCMYG